MNLATIKDNRQNSFSQGAYHHLITEISQPQDRGPYNAVPGGSHYCYRLGTTMGFLGGTSGKESACKCKRYKRCGAGSIPESGRSPGGGHATHSSVLGRRNPWTEEPGGLQSIESQRVRHNWATNMNSKLRSYGIKNRTDRQDRNSQGLEGGLRRLHFTPQTAESHRGLLNNSLIDLHSLSTGTEAKGKSVV